MPALVKSGARMNINSFLPFFDLSLSVNLYNINLAANQSPHLQYDGQNRLHRISNTSFSSHSCVRVWRQYLWPDLQFPGGSQSRVLPDRIWSSSSKRDSRGSSGDKNTNNYPEENCEELRPGVFSFLEASWLWIQAQCGVHQGVRVRKLLYEMRV